MDITQIRVRRDNLAEAGVATQSVDLADGEALLRIDRFALTANNVTYAAHGTDMRYWDFFPAPEGFGVVPVWGFAEVVASRAVALDEGARVYGYWPMASHAVLMPVKARATGFSDGTPHRQPLPQVYNGYEFASGDWGDEAVQALFRPLYTTSFVLDVMLRDRPVDTLILTAASSKTALGLAQAAKGRQRVVGLTSPANRGFVEATGYYDLVLDYGDVAGLAALGGRAALVDFAGNGAVHHDVHATLGDHLIESHIVGDTHWQAPAGAPLPGPRPQLFFAPTVIVERIGEWGAAGFQERLVEAWRGFLGSIDWLRVEEIAGADAVAAAWERLAAGRIDPRVGLLASV